MSLGSNAEESKQVSEVSDTRREDGDITAVGVEEAVNSISDQPGDPSSYKRRSFKGKPRIPTAVDTSRLNKHLTNIWSSKRKKSFKKSSMAPGDMVRESEVELPDVGGASDAADESVSLISQASTVIIVKTLPQKQEESHSPAKMMRVSEDVDNKSEVPVQKGSRDIAERLKARKQRFTASSGGGNVDASVNDSGQVACEVCAETVGDYVQLVRHVCEQHEDCTYVRNYLDEIQPIADALLAVRLECEACGRTFAGQTALAAHRHECSTGISKTKRVSKLGAQRKRVTANLLSPSQHAGDQSRRNEAATLTSKPGKKFATAQAAGDRQDRWNCAHCKRTFRSEDKLSGHVARVHSQTDLKQRAGVGRSRGKPSTTTASSKSAAAVPDSGSKPQQPANSAQLSASSGNQFQRCDHCTARFSRTSLLVTHMRYCLKAGDSNR